MVTQHAHQTSAAQQLIEVCIGILLGGHGFVVLLVVIHFYFYRNNIIENACSFRAALNKQLRATKRSSNMKFRAN